MAAMSASLLLLDADKRMAGAVTGPDYSIGSRGAGVRELQGRLGFLGFYHGHLDGLFGWQTYWAVRDFKQAFGLPVDGAIHDRAWAKLLAATPGYQGGASASTFASPAAASSGGTVSSPPGQNATASAVLGISPNDINLIAHVVYGEARGQPFIGQVAVAAVILNRYHSSIFPHSIPAIIFQPGAFTSISNGQAWLGLHPQNVEAAQDAVHGWDPTHGALYYWNPATATSPWIWSQPVMLQIGQHVFAK